MNIHGLKLQQQEVRRRIREERKKKNPDHRKLKRMSSKISRIGEEILILRKNKKEVKKRNG